MTVQDYRRVGRQRQTERRTGETGDTSGVYRLSRLRPPVHARCVNTHAHTVREMEKESSENIHEEVAKSGLDSYQPDDRCTVLGIVAS